MSSEDVKRIAAALTGKKARLKSVSALPADTKAAKLPRDVRNGLEDQFGAKLGKVRVHVGGNARDVCKAVKARAFTHGTDIYLAKPADAKNTDLLAHELTHVIQQGGGRLPKPKAGKVLVSR